MNVYDFDKTIYNGDSSIDFFLFALKSKPSLLRFLPKQAIGFLLYGLGRIEKTALKERFFSFLCKIETETLVEQFWETHHQKIYNWYLMQKQPDDIVISASPEFLLKPLCQKLKIAHLIASKVHPSSGKFLGENCRGEEKVQRLQAEFPNAHIEKFYSDSLSDAPLANIADQAFLIKKGCITKWKDLAR